MTPKILDYQDGEIIITLEAFIIKELNDIINKHGEKDAKPYLAYVHLMTWPESPYLNLPDDEKSDTVVYDVIQATGDFDIEDELIAPAMQRLSSLWESKTKRYYDSLGIAIEKLSIHLRDVEVSSGGKDSNLGEINRMIRDAGSTFKSYKEVEKQVDEEMKTKMRGKSTLGDY